MSDNITVSDNVRDCHYDWVHVVDNHVNVP